MMINTDNLVSITDANQNFSRVARMVDENGAAIILRIMYRAISSWSSTNWKRSSLQEMKIYKRFQSVLWQKISMHLRCWQNEKAEQ